LKTFQAVVVEAVEIFLGGGKILASPQDKKRA
jgi:hypothetical protein